MPHLELILDYHEHKTVAAFKKLGELVIWFFITIIAACIPLVYGVSHTTTDVAVGSQNNPDIFPAFIFGASLVYLMLFFIFHLKYDEYKEKYLSTFIKIVLRDDISGGSTFTDYDTFAKRIVIMTGEDYYQVMNCLFLIIPPDTNGSPARA